MIQTILFSSGPKIRVILEFDKRQINRIRLCQAKSFECAVIGDADKSEADTLIEFLMSYSEKKPKPIDLPPLARISSFRSKVLDTLHKVPFGSTLTYGQLALQSGYPLAARAVGTACHFNPFPLLIPCHRVVASGGKIGGFAYDIEIKRLLINFESESS